MWVIRGGEQNRLVDRFVDEAVTGLGHPAVPDAEFMSRADIRRLLVDEGTSAAVDDDVAMLLAFVNEIQVGDSILMPDPARGEVLLGEITGRYQFDDAVPPERCRHRRSVTWLVRHDIADLPAPLQKVPAQRPVLVQNRAAEWSGHMAKVRSGAVGRDPADRRAVRAAATTRSSGTRAARTPKPAPVLEKACPSCHLRKPVRQFDGEWCVDCVG